MNRQLDRVQDRKEGRGEGRSVTAWKPPCPGKNWEARPPTALAAVRGRAQCPELRGLLQDKWL